MIDKFIGDGVMAVFGVRHPGFDDARNAVFAGLALVSAISRWGERRVAQGLTPVRIGVGIHYGEVIAGAIGDDRLEYRVIGDTVNVAARIEQLTVVLGESLLVSGDVLAASPGMQNDLDLEELPTRSLAGKSRPTRLYRSRHTAQIAVAATRSKASLAPHEG
jgi:adenylate cyclase